ncbi:2-dehydropantoate 2-reductase [Actinomycetaceae bacterium TAE3-ERU4]|nr:2-dehydropantoate 2-reductase [Actinomycetaceae bacterium TAE3-ERU4]
MRIAIAGAGAMGSRFGYMLSQAGNEVVLADLWAEHVKAISDSGLRIDWNGEDRVARLDICFPQDLSGHFDLVICFTKAMGLEAMLSQISHILDDETMVLCLLNGIGHEKTVRKFVPEANFLIGNTIWTAGLVGPGQVHLHGEGSLALQNVAVGDERARESAQRVARVLDEAGLNASYSDNVMHSIYRKAALNGSVNGICALLDCNLMSYGKTAQAAEISAEIISEFARVAQVEGITLDQDEVLEYVISTFDPAGIGEHFPSLHQDLVQNHRLTEIDYLNGAIARKAIEYGFRAPYCELVTKLVHAKEQLLGAK